MQARLQPEGPRSGHPSPAMDRRTYVICANSMRICEWRESKDGQFNNPQIVLNENSPPLTLYFKPTVPASCPDVGFTTCNLSVEIDDISDTDGFGAAECAVVFRALGTGVEGSSLTVKALLTPGYRQRTTTIQVGSFLGRLESSRYPGVTAALQKETIDLWRSARLVFFKMSRTLAVLVVLSFHHSALARDDLSELKWRRFFATTDVNKDGMLSLDDYQEELIRLAQTWKISEDKVNCMSKEVVEKAWNLIPFDKEGKGNPVTMDEMIESLKERSCSPQFKERATEFFTLVFNVLSTQDGDKDSVSLKEWTDYSRIRKISDDVAAVSYDKMDTHCDRKVTYDEFITAGLDFFCGKREIGPGAWFFGQITGNE